MSLSQTQLDLRQYTADKLFKLMGDVVQASRIAEQPDEEARALMSAIFMNMAATLALHGNLSKQKWLRFCEECWGRAVKAREEMP